MSTATEYQLALYNGIGCTSYRSWQITSDSWVYSLDIYEQISWRLGGRHIINASLSLYLLAFRLRTIPIHCVMCWRV